MEKTTLTPQQSRELEAQVLQLCHYIEDGYVAYEQCSNTLDEQRRVLNWQFLKQKAQQIKKMIMEE